MGKRDLDPGGFHVGDYQEDGNRGDERQQLRTHVLQEICPVHNHLYEPREESHCILIGYRYPADKTIDDGL